MVNKRIKVRLILSLAIVISFNGLQVYADTNETTANVTRIGGSNRYETAVKISQQGWKSPISCVILATGNDFPDALSATPLSKKYNAPILLTDKDSIPQNVLDEIKRLSVSKVFIIGGTGAISQAVQNKLSTMNITTERLCGKDRYETSIRIAEKLGNSTGSCIVTNGSEFQDALSVSSIAAKKGMPILLTAQNNLSNTTQTYLTNNKITNAYIIGGTDLISDKIAKDFSNAERITGNTAYERNINIIKKFEGDLDLTNVCFATGKNFSDGLAGSAYASNIDSPIILVDDSNISSATSDYINNKISNVKNTYVFGLSGAINDSAVNKLTGAKISDTNTSSNADIIKFNDATFESAVRSAINKPTGDVHKSDVAKVTELDLSKKGIKNIDGIENFTNLKKLDVGFNELTTIDVSKNTALEYLDCKVNKITSIDVSKNTLLAFFRIDSNELTSIDISKNTKLYEFHVSNNKIKSIDVSNNLELTSLHVDSNLLTNIDVSKNIKLNFFECANNNLTTLDLSKNINLYSFTAFDNEIKTLYCFKDSWDSTRTIYKEQYTDSTYTTTANDLTITIKK